jgi:antitoxin (DNA-binding transcriptional repressor) of toxin-antitoxin stability system
MISVGIKDLKNKLSQYLRLVREGQRVLVKDHNRIIAEIRKYSQDSAEGKFAAYLESEALQGRIISAKCSGSNIALILEGHTMAGTQVDWKSAYSQSRSDRR